MTSTCLVLSNTSPYGNRCRECARVRRVHHSVARPVLLPQHVRSDGALGVAPHVSVAVLLVAIALPRQPSPFSITVPHYEHAPLSSSVTVRHSTARGSTALDRTGERSTVGQRRTANEMAVNKGYNSSQKGRRAAHLLVAFPGQLI